MITFHNLTVAPGCNTVQRTPAFFDHLRAESPPPFWMSIRSLGPNERDRIARHLLALDSHDRYLRFGNVVSDEQLERYVDSLDFERDQVFGIYNRSLELIAMAQLAFAPGCDCAELGLSVAAHARGRGYGARLFARAANTARNKGKGIVIHVLSENTAMLRIVRNAGATVVRNGPECEAHLRVPCSTLDSRLITVAFEHIAQIEYQLKARAQQFWLLLAGAWNFFNPTRSAVQSVLK